MDTPLWVPLVVAVLGIGGTLGGAWLTLRSHERSQEAQRQHDWRLRSAAEVREIYREFLRAAYGVKYKLDHVASLLTQPTEDQAERDRRLQEAAGQVGSDQATELRVRLREIETACGGTPAEIGEQVSAKVQGYLQLVRQIWAYEDVRPAMESFRRRANRCTREIDNLLGRLSEAMQPAMWAPRDDYIGRPATGELVGPNQEDEAMNREPTQDPPREVRTRILEELRRKFGPNVKEAPGRSGELSRDGEVVWTLDYEVGDPSDPAEPMQAEEMEVEVDGVRWPVIVWKRVSDSGAST